MLTDTLHKPGFKLHSQILASLFLAVQGDVITVPLWPSDQNVPAGTTNQQFLRDLLLQMFTTSFPNLTQPQLAATNRAFEEIHNLQLRYDGFSLIQRKNTKRRDETVALVEDNVLATISAMTAVSPMLPSLGGEEEEEG